MNAFFHKFTYIIFYGKLWKIASVGRESSRMENGKLWKINVPTGGQQHTFSRRGIGLCASGDHVNGVENLIDFGNRSNFPRRSFFARRRGRERAVGGDNATHHAAQKMNGVENLEPVRAVEIFPNCPLRNLGNLDNCGKFDRSEGKPPHRSTGLVGRIRRGNLFMERRGKLDRYGRIFHAVPLMSQHGAPPPTQRFYGTAWKI